jgi:RES domain
MMVSLFDGLCLADYQDDCYRNIVSLRVSQNLFDDLIDGQEGWDAGIQLVLDTKPYNHISPQPIIDRPFEDAIFHEAISYPFENWKTSRYSAGSFGVWYGADTLETTIYETAYHWRKGFLADVGWQNQEGLSVERRVHLVQCRAALLDFRPKIKDYPALISTTDYMQTQQIGTRIKHDGHPGLVTQSARCEGTVLALFTPNVLSNPRQHCYLTYTLMGEQVRVERQPSITLMTI